MSGFPDCHIITFAYSIWAWSEQSYNKKHIRIVLTQSFDSGLGTFISCRDIIVHVLFILGVFNFKYFFPFTLFDSLGTEFFFIST